MPALAPPMSYQSRPTRPRLRAGQCRRAWIRVSRPAQSCAMANSGARHGMVGLALLADAERALKEARSIAVVTLL